MWWDCRWRGLRCVQFLEDACQPQPTAYIAVVRRMTSIMKICPELRVPESPSSRQGEHLFHHPTDFEDIGYRAGPNPPNYRPTPRTGSAWRFTSEISMVWAVEVRTNWKRLAVGHRSLAESSPKTPPFVGYLELNDPNEAPERKSPDFAVLHTNIQHHSDVCNRDDDLKYPARQGGPLPWNKLNHHRPQT